MILSNVMASAKPKPRTIDEYLADAKANQRAALEVVRKSIHAVASRTAECISYGIPVLRLNGRSLIFFGAWANHCSFFRGSSGTLKRFRGDLKHFRVTKGTVRFSPHNPLPITLLKKLVKARIAENRT